MEPFDKIRLLLMPLIAVVWIGFVLLCLHDRLTLGSAFAFGVAFALIYFFALLWGMREREPLRRAERYRELKRRKIAAMHVQLGLGSQEALAQADRELVSEYRDSQ